MATRRPVGSYLFFLGVMALAGSVAFALIYWFTKPDAYSQLASTTKPLPISTDKSAANNNTGCKEGFRLFANQEFALCYPDRFTSIVETVENKAVRVYFTQNSEQLLVAKDFEKNWGPHLCRIEEDVNVASMSALRTAFHEEYSSGCGAITGFATLVKTKDILPLYIGLVKKEGTYQNASEFLTIEQSLNLYENNK